MVKHFNVEGMHCGACAAGIQMLLSTTDGVKNATVDYDNKKGEVDFDESKITVEGIQKAVEELGYKVIPAD